MIRRSHLHILTLPLESSSVFALGISGLSQWSSNDNVPERGGADTPPKHAVAKLPGVGRFGLTSNFLGGRLGTSRAIH
jgi:hypothetical protein